MNTSQLLKRIEEDDGLDFVAIVMTPFQVTSSVAALMYLHNQLKRDLRGIYLIAPHGITGRAIFENQICLPDYVHAEIATYEQSVIGKKGISYLLSGDFRIRENHNKKSALYFMAVDYPYYVVVEKVLNNTAYDVINVILADGIFPFAGYNFSSLFHIAWEENAKKAIRLFAKDFALKLLTKRYNLKILEFRPSAKKFMDNKVALEYYPEAFKASGKGTEVPNDDKAVIFCNVPKYSDTEEDYNEKMNIVVDILLELEKRGYHIYVKNHPRDGKLVLPKLEHAVYLKPEYGFEQIVANMPMKPAMVITVSSSASFSSAMFWGVESYILYDLMDEKYKKRDYAYLVDPYREFCKVSTNLKTGRELKKRLQME